jgi:hypothetical protein
MEGICVTHKGSDSRKGTYELEHQNLDERMRRSVYRELFMAVYIRILSDCVCVILTSQYFTDNYTVGSSVCETVPSEG